MNSVNSVLRQLIKVSGKRSKSEYERRSYFQGWPIRAGGMTIIPSPMIACSQNIFLIAGKAARETGSLTCWFLMKSKKRILLLLSLQKKYYPIKLLAGAEVSAPIKYISGNDIHTGRKNIYPIASLFCGLQPGLKQIAYLRKGCKPGCIRKTGQ